MSMKKTGPAIRLQAANNKASEAELGKALETARQNPNREVILAWLGRTSTGELIPYNLICFISMEMGLGGAMGSQRRSDGNAYTVEPMWTLLRGTGENQLSAWTQQTSDLGQILGTIELESTPRAGEQERSEVAEQMVKLFKDNMIGGAPISKTTRSRATNHRIKLEQSQTGTFSLAGNLSDIHITDVMQSVNICKMSGMLELIHKTEQSSIYFNNGEPTHAVTINNLSGREFPVGQDALLEALTKTDGSFRFLHNRTSSNQTIDRRLSGLLLEGASLSDYAQFLKDMNIDENSRLSQLEPGISREKLTAKLENGVPVSEQRQRDFLNCFDGSRTLSDVLSMQALPKCKWLPIVYNLVNLKLLGYPDNKTVAPVTIPEDLLPQDKEIAAAGKALFSIGTNLISYPLLVHFIEKELLRFHQNGSPFSIALLEIGGINSSSGSSDEVVSALADCMVTCLTKLDYIAHLRGLEFAILMPGKDISRALETMTALIELLAQVPAGDIGTPTVVAGVASVPLDCEELIALVKMAFVAREEARQAEIPLLCAAEAQGTEALKHNTQTNIPNKPPKLAVDLPWEVYLKLLKTQRENPGKSVSKLVTESLRILLQG